MQRLWILGFAFLAIAAFGSNAGAQQRRLTERKLAEMPIVLKYDARLARDHNLTEDDRKAIVEFSDAAILEYVFEIRLALASGYFIVRCDTGPSADYSCRFQDSARKFSETQMYGLFFEINGDGCVYTSGHNDTMFDVKRKYCLSNGELLESFQPYHYVGIKSRAVQDIRMYLDEGMKKPVGVIKKGEFIEVLIADIVTDNAGLQDAYPQHKRFLVRDARGLTGWVNLTGAREDNEIKGMFFNGD